MYKLRLRLSYWFLKWGVEVLPPGDLTRIWVEHGLRTAGEGIQKSLEKEENESIG